MKIQLKVTRKNEDGSADAVVDFDDEGLQIIVQYGVIAMLTEAMDDMKKKEKFALSKRTKQNVLEDSISAFYSIIDDIKLLYKTYGDRKRPIAEDEMANALLGLETKADMVAYWAENAYEQYFELNDYASEEAKKRRAVIMGWGEDDSVSNDK
jgi:hypothetical protein